MYKYLLSIIIMIIIIKFQNCIVSFILDFVSLPCRILFYLFVICILNLRYSVDILDGIKLSTQKTQFLDVFHIIDWTINDGGSRGSF